MDAAFLAVMEELNVVKAPMFGFFTNSLAVANGLAIWSGRRTMEIWPIKAMPLWGLALWKLEGCIKVEYVDIHQNNSLPGLEGD